MRSQHNIKNLINENIKFPIVFLINQNGENLGKISIKEAYEKAVECGLDLVCISPNSNPPICKILNYGKYRFEIQKKNKKNKYKQSMLIINTKEIQLTPQICDYDLKIKANKAIKFLKSGDKIKIVVKYKSRQLSHIEFGENILKKFISYVQDFSTIEKEPKLEGKNMIVILASKFKKGENEKK